MKQKEILLFFLIFFWHKQIIGQDIDSIACKIVEKNLAVINDYFINKNSELSIFRPRAIDFLTDLTGITSESDGNYIGQTSPTRKDYILWKNWYLLYKRNIFWDEKKKMIVVHKEVRSAILE